MERRWPCTMYLRRFSPESIPNLSKLARKMVEMHLLFRLGLGRPWHRTAAAARSTDRSGFIYRRSRRTIQICFVVYENDR